MKKIKWFWSVDKSCNPLNLEKNNIIQRPMAQASGGLIRRQPGKLQSNI